MHLIWNTSKMVQSHSRLAWNHILWPNNAKALWHHKSNLICWHLHTWLHQEMPQQIQPPIPYAHKTHHILSCHQCLVTNCMNCYGKHFHQTWLGGQKLPPANCWLYPLLCSRCWQHGPKSKQHHCTAHCKSNKTYWTMCSSTSWQSCHPSHCHYLLWGKWHGAQSAQWCFSALKKYKNEAATLGTSSVVITNMTTNHWT